MNGIGYSRQNIFINITAAENRRTHAALGRVRQVNLLDAQATELPVCVPLDIVSASLGPYQMEMARGYATNIQWNQLRTANPPPGN